jgi:hypothetical protein
MHANNTIGMSLRNRPPGQTGVATELVSPLLGALHRVKAHVSLWPRRYVEMRLEAIDGD